MNTEISPSPRYPYGFLPPVYLHAATIESAPIAMSHSEERRARRRPNIAASAKKVSAAERTCFGSAAPLPTSRIGPTRSVSVPRIPSE